MKTIDDLKDLLGERGAIRYLKDYHQSRIHTEGTWNDATYKLDVYSSKSWKETEADILSHANFMNGCGPDLMKYIAL